MRVASGRFDWLFASLRGYSPSWLAGDALAAVTLAAIAIPEQLATARLVGMPPTAGLIAFLAGALAIAAFGRNRILSVGADSTIAPIMAGSVIAVAAMGTAHFSTLVVTLSLMVGTILLLSKPLRLGWIADMLSVPVTTGFLAGIAVHIIAGQLPAVMDFNPSSSSLLGRIGEITVNLPHSNVLTLAIGLGVFSISQFSERVSRLIPGPLVGIVLSAFAVWGWQAEMKGVPVMAPLSLAWPAIGFKLPGWADFIFLMAAALVVALVCMMQTAAVEQYVPNKNGARNGAASDFAAIGVGSLLSGLCGAFAVNASPPRTAAVAGAGGRTQLSGLLAGALVLALVLLFANDFALVPQAALSGVLIFIGARIVRIGAMRSIYRCSKPEFLLVLASAALVILMPVGIGVGMSIVLSMMHSIYIIARPNCAELERVSGTTIWWTPDGERIGEREPGVLVFAPGAPLNFTNANYIVDVLNRKIAAMDTPCRLVVIEANGMIDIDYTGAQIMRQAISDLHERNIDVAMARMESMRAKDAATQTGIVDQIGADHIFQSVEDAVTKLAPFGDHGLR